MRDEVRAKQSFEFKNIKWGKSNIIIKIQKVFILIIRYVMLWMI